MAARIALTLCPPERRSTTRTVYGAVKKSPADSSAATLAGVFAKAEHAQGWLDDGEDAGDEAEDVAGQTGPFRGRVFEELKWRYGLPGVVVGNMWCRYVGALLVSSQSL